MNTLVTGTPGSGKTTKQRAGFMEWQDYLIREAKKFPVDFIDGNDRQATYKKVIALTRPTAK